MRVCVCIYGFSQGEVGQVVNIRTEQKPYALAYAHVSFFICVLVFAIIVRWTA